MGLSESKDGFSDAVLGKNTPVLYYVSKNNCPGCHLMSGPIGSLQSESSAFPLSGGTRIQKVNLDDATLKNIKKKQDEGAPEAEIQDLQKMRTEALFLKKEASIKAVPALLLVKDGQVVSEWKRDTKLSNLKPEHIENWVNKSLSDNALKPEKPVYIEYEDPDWLGI